MTNYPLSKFINQTSTDTFGSNSYNQDTFTSNGYATDTFGSNSYNQATFTSNGYASGVFSSNNYVQTQLGTKLDSSSYTAADVLTKIKTVDGSGSGLDADLLDGKEASVFASNSYNQATFTSNGYASDAYSSNAYNQATYSSNAYNQATYSSNAYNQATYSSNTYVGDIFVSNNYLQDNSSSGLPSGTKQIFVQTAAPTGWTKDTTHNDKALRVVSGTASNGGAQSFTNVFGAGKATSSHTLSTPQIPAHSHSTTFQRGPINAPGAGYGKSYVQNSESRNTNNAGGGGSHSHSLSLDISYVDTIIATKD